MQSCHVVSTHVLFEPRPAEISPERTAGHERECPGFIADFVPRRRADLRLAFDLLKLARTPFSSLGSGCNTIMQSRELIDLAVTLADRSDVIMSGTRRLNEASLQHYWVAARSLISSWGVAVRRCTDQFEEVEYTSDALWLRWTPIFEEVLVSEMVTRVWACLLESCDRRWGLQEYSPIGRSIFAGHLDVRRRILGLLLRGRQRAAYPVWRLNRTRQSVERWTDLLLGSLAPRIEVDAYCFDPQRLRTRSTMRHSEPGVRLAILRAVAQCDLNFAADVVHGHVAMHRACHTGILGCLGPELFRESGEMIPGWQARLLSLTDDTQGLLDDWASLMDSERNCEEPRRRPSSRF